MGGFVGGSSELDGYDLTARGHGSMEAFTLGMQERVSVELLHAEGGGGGSRIGSAQALAPGDGKRGVSKPLASSASRGSKSPPSLPRSSVLVVEVPTAIHSFDELS
jgi:hypothetical protein